MRNTSSAVLRRGFNPSSRCFYGWSPHRSSASIGGEGSEERFSVFSVRLTFCNPVVPVLCGRGLGRAGKRHPVVPVLSRRAVSAGEIDGPPPPRRSSAFWTGEDSHAQISRVDVNSTSVQNVTLADYGYGLTYHVLNPSASSNGLMNCPTILVESTGTVGWGCVLNPV